MNLVEPYRSNAPVPDPALTSCSSVPGGERVSCVRDGMRGGIHVLVSLTCRIAPEETKTMRDLDSTSFSLRR